MIFSLKDGFQPKGWFSAKRMVFSRMKTRLSDDFQLLTFLCFEGCYEIRGNHGTLASCLNLSWVYLYLSTGLSWWFPFLVPPHFPGVPVRSRNVPFRCIGVWGPVYRCSGPDFPEVLSLTWTLCEGFPERPPPLINGFRSRGVWVPSLPGSPPTFRGSVEKCLGPFRS